MERWLAGWLARHRHPVSRCAHAIGVPLTVAAVVLAGWQLWQWRWDLWWRPVLLLIVGYALQGLGHRIEGSPMGEWTLLKRLLGRGPSQAEEQSDRHDPANPSA